MKENLTESKAKAVTSSLNVRLPIKILVALILSAMIWPLGASAECRWEWLCDASGADCSKGAVCDSVDDTMPPPPPVERPVVSASTPPEPTPGMAPKGASDCKQLRRCAVDGTCIWDILCVCL
jgi:hypothetical protein